MIDQREYWRRVEKAARKWMEGSLLRLGTVAKEYLVLPSDVYNRVLEIEEEQDDGSKRVLEACGEGCSKVRQGAGFAVMGDCA